MYLLHLGAEKELHEVLVAYLDIPGMCARSYELRLALWATIILPRVIFVSYGLLPCGFLQQRYVQLPNNAPSLDLLYKDVKSHPALDDTFAQQA